MTSTTVSPNSDLGVDSMLNIYGHEFVEAVSDPLKNAWYDSNGDGELFVVFNN